MIAYIYDLKTQEVEVVSHYKKPQQSIYTNGVTNTRIIKILPDRSIINYTDNCLSIWDPETRQYRICAHNSISDLEILSNGRIVIISHNRLEIWK